MNDLRTPESSAADVRPVGISHGVVQEPLAPGLPPTCRVCGTTLVGPWCHGCGQASGAVQRRFGEALFGQTGKLLRTLKFLLQKPGELAAEIDENRDRNSLRPGLLLTNIAAV